MAFLSIMVPKTGLIISISTLPSATTLQASGVMQRLDDPRIALLSRIILESIDALNRLRAWQWSMEYMYIFMHPSAEDLDMLARYANEDKLVPVVGAKVDLRNVAKVREACEQIYRGKGGVGKTILEIVRD